MADKENSNLISNAANMGTSNMNHITIDVDEPNVDTLPQFTNPSSNNTNGNLPSYNQANSNQNLGTNTSSNTVVSILQQSSHPTILIAHLSFRVAALILYLFGNWVTGQFVLIFVLSVLCLAFDFWTVKNISGRFLVGLRWWSTVSSSGSSTWSFECRDRTVSMNSIDSTIFWYSLYATPLIWILLALVALISGKFGWLLIAAVAIALSLTNLVGYHRADRHQKAIQGMQTNDTGFLSAISNPTSTMLGGVVKNIFG